MRLVVALSVLLPCALSAQEVKKAGGFHPGVDDAKVDQAIKKGVEFLRGKGSPGHAHSGAKHSDEFILWTFIHAGVSPGDARYKAMLDRVLQDPLEQTYKVALQAMCLEELDRAKYQGRLWQCAQFLVDNQCKNGQWSYGDPTEFVKDVPTGEIKKDTATGSPAKGGVRDFGTPEKKEKPRIVKKLPVKKMKDGPAAGDNSNTQYAALGIRACHDAGIRFPEDVILLAVKWWMESQHAGVKESGYGGVRGWNYKTEGGDKDGRGAYMSMTAGAVGSLCIYDYISGKDWKKSGTIKSGVNWVASNFSVTENKGRPDPKDWYYYGLYAIERAGILYDIDKFGDHDWYAEGAKHLLAIQQADGSWKGDSDTVWNTCFAILFLKRATKALVATGDGR